MLRPKLSLLALGLLLSSGQNAAAVEFPNAGSQIQQIPPAPTLEKAPPQIRIQQKNKAEAGVPDDMKIRVDALHLTGAHVYTDAELLALTGFEPGRELSLADLRGMAAKITDHYHKDGYFLAQAYLPAQDIKNGAVTIAVLEGQFGNIQLRNNTNLSDSLINSRLRGIDSADTINIEPLENRLLLLSDIPGVNVSSTLTPGATLGASDLIVDVDPGRRVTGSVDADNAGNRYTGEYRAGGTVNFNNLLGRGDVATLRGVTSGRGLNYGRASYQMPFGKATLGVAYSRLGYRLGKEFDGLDAHGTADIASVYGSYPLIRSRNTNLSVQLGYDHKRLRDRAEQFVSNRKADAVSLSLLGDHRDNFGGGGLSAFSLTGTTGRINIQTPEVRAYDGITAHSNGHYNKLGFSAMRLQNLTRSVSLYAGINGQFASKNLDSSEKMSLGGINGVRAYPEGEAWGDEGYVINVEARWLLPQFAANQLGQVQLIAFADTGTTTAHKNPWFPGPNRRTLSGAGVGVNWMDYNNFAVKVSYARKLGNAETLSAPDKNGRFWVQLVKYF
ncbi:ShlB/FhaC/HecB family hemolysin secretion/activation protein [Pollutimonas bauzanensis]|uniref:Hemolysin activation/secretion protein n=1 Tax=Pollutimonas bauzanensis TaxID=658167 RepID=A0A1M5XMR4_9BURK|nr:ShlB/FhaC/HecB family hemolysin secretion/activation protein [Pollutimonas bauzanensis]SHI01127.1 Hemolysin activation/secretion protein [Pollutimonas bauzanensis]